MCFSLKDNIKRSFFFHRNRLYDHRFTSVVSFFFFVFFFRVVGGRKWFVEAQREMEPEGYLMYLVYAKNHTLLSIDTQTY